MKENKSIITTKDVLILRQLMEDGRKSSASISKEIDLGREIVNYRIKRLIKENLIVKFVPKINKNAIHYQEYLILLKLNLSDEISKEKFIREEIGNKYLIWVVKSESGWDLIVRLFASNIDEFRMKLEEILENFSKVLARYYTIMSLESIKDNEREILLENLFHDDMIRKDFLIIKKQEKNLHQIDEKDREIINLLEEDARVQYKEIADKLNISSDTVKYRIEKMKEQGVIENFSPIINFNKLGLIQFAGILKLSYLTNEEEKELEKELEKEKSISKLIKNIYTQEYFMTIIAKNENEAKNIEKKISEIFKKKIETFEIFKIDHGK